VIVIAQRNVLETMVTAMYNLLGFFCNELTDLLK